MRFSTATKWESQTETTDHNSVVEEIDVWLKETDMKEKTVLMLTEMDFLNKIVGLFL